MGEKRNEWHTLDDALLEISRQRLGGVQDLLNSVRTTALEWGDAGDALVAKSRNDEIVAKSRKLRNPLDK